MLACYSLLYFVEKLAKQFKHLQFLGSGFSLLNRQKRRLNDFHVFVRCGSFDGGWSALVKRCQCRKIADELWMQVHVVWFLDQKGENLYYQKNKKNKRVEVISLFSIQS